MGWSTVLYILFLILFIVFVCVMIAGVAGMASKSPAEAWMWTLLIVGAVGMVACSIFLLFDAHWMEVRTDLTVKKNKTVQSAKIM